MVKIETALKLCAFITIVNPGPKLDHDKLICKWVDLPIKMLLFWVPLQINSK
jgi:hypothetical protein